MKQEKQCYRIGEIARLYGVCADTLRYYEEQGLLHPARDAENGYRLYTLRDVCTLNVIRSLCALGMPTKEIAGYLSKRSVRETQALLEREREMTDRRIRELERERAETQRRTEQLVRAAAMPDGVCVLRRIGDRPCVCLSDGPIAEPEVDLALKKLEKKHEGLLHRIHAGRMGAIVDEASAAGGSCGQYSSVFFLSGDETPADACLPGGEYACVVYRGAYSRLPEVWRALRAFVRENGRRCAAAPLEVYHIDAHDTDDADEYVTELQVLTEIEKKC